MKGQMFIVAAVFMIIGMIMIKNLVSPTLDETKRYTESITYDRAIRNIASEYKYLANTALGRPYTAIDAPYYVSQFSSFLRDDINGFSSVYSLVIMNLTTATYNMVLGNYLGSDINITVSATDSNPNSQNIILADKTNQTLSFTITGASVNVTLNYTANRIATLERFSLPQMEGVTLFYDIRLLKDSDYFQIKDIYNRTET
jgi:hypothetical protein